MTQPPPVALALPFTGRWLVQNSPAQRVPSHGTNRLGSRYAIDFVGVDDRRRSAAHRDWRTVLATEPADRYFAFGRPILAPVTGTVVAVHDSEPDHDGRRSQLALIPYVLGQAGRLRAGVAAVAGNHVTIALPDESAYVVLAHLRAGSVRVAPGDRLTVGQPIGECGNSGNSTQPHVHLQVSDRPDAASARGVPLVFQRYREQLRGTTEFRPITAGIPRNGAVVEPLPDGADG